MFMKKQRRKIHDFRIIRYLFAFGLTAKLLPKAREDIIDPSPPSPYFNEFEEKSNKKCHERHELS
jgi:hypothetical protein